MRFSWRTEWPFWLLLAAMLVLTALVWPHAPDRIPIRWDMKGQVDGYGGRFEGLLLVPLIALFLYVLFRVLPKLDPLHANYDEFAGAYTLFRFTVTAFLALCHGIIILWVQGHRPPIQILMPIFMGAMFVVLGLVLGKVQPNWFVGIRTPWALSSRRSWTETHRAARVVFMATGLGFMAGGALSSEPVMTGALILTGVGILGLVVYSYLLWRDDPDRHSPTPAK